MEFIPIAATWHMTRGTKYDYTIDFDMLIEIHNWQLPTDLRSNPLAGSPARCIREQSRMLDHEHHHNYC